MCVYNLSDCSASDEYHTSICRYTLYINFDITYTLMVTCSVVFIIINIFINKLSNSIIIIV